MEGNRQRSRLNLEAAVGPTAGRAAGCRREKAGNRTTIS